MKKMIACTLLAGAVAAGGCRQAASDSPTPALDPANLNTSVAPGVDFYEYACGGWMKSHPLPDEFARFGVFDRLRENNKEQVRALVEGLRSEPREPGSLEDKIVLFYETGLDSVRLNAEGAAPVREELAAVRAVSDRKSLSEAVARLHRAGAAPFFVPGVGPDEKNSSVNLVQLYQAGLGMGDRDYYLQADSAMETIRNAYRDYVRRLFILAGDTPEEAEAAAEAVWKVEQGIAEAAFPREALRDPQSNYHKVPVSDWASGDRFIDWNVYFETLGLPGLAEVDAKQLAYYDRLDRFLSGTTLDEQKAYLAFHLLNTAAPYLSDDFVTASFDFYGKTLSGRQEQQPRWKRSLDAVNGALSEAVGQFYVAKYFPPASKEKMLELVGNLRQALSRRIDGLAWMGDTTKRKAQEKLAAFTVKIGYPDRWRDYSGLEVRNDSYWDNVRRSNNFDMDYQLADVGKPVDKSRWYMSPQTVNAYYSPTTNEICFPAAILQPPFFNPDADDAVNYGAIGVVIGHEMTHGFDDQGRHYDPAGNLADWWTPEDAARFKERADRLVAQYDAIVVADTVHANGRFTLGENIADHGGLLVAHSAYRNSLEGKDAPAPVDGLTDEQRFFLGYATLWAQNIRKEEILRLTKMDPHSLGKWRVNAALRNIDPFYTAFGIVKGDPMYLAPEERVMIW